MTCTPRLVRINSDIPQEESSDAVGASQKDAQNPPPLRSLLTRPVLTSIANYAMLILLEMASLALIPLIWSTPVKFGGLDMSPASIGMCMSVFGCMDGIFQFTVFPHAVRCFGLRRVFVTCIAASAVVIIMFPLENLVLRHAFGGSTTAVWPLIFVQLLSYSTNRMGFSKSLTFIYQQGNAEYDAQSVRCRNDLCQFCNPQQAVIRRCQWFLAHSGCCSECDRTGGC